MHTPSPTSASSHSDAAAALVQLSQTPAQLATNRHRDTSTPSSLEQQSTDVASYILETLPQGNQNTITAAPKPSKNNIHVFSSPVSDSAGIIKVSNSDDEDMIEHGCDSHHDDSSDAPPRAVPRNEIQMSGTPPAASSARVPAPTFAPELTVAKRPNATPSHRSPYTQVEYPRGMNVVAPALARSSVVSGQWGTQVPKTAYPILTIAPDELDSYMRRTAALNQQGYGAPLRYASTPLHLQDQPLQQVRPQRLPFLEPVLGSRHVFHPPPHSQPMLPQAKVDATAVQEEDQHASSVHEPPAPSNSFGVLVPGQASSVGAEGNKKVQIPRAPPRASATKRVRAPSKKQEASASRDGFGPKQIDIRDFKYHTIKSINMPARADLTPGEKLPEPEPYSHPYDQDIDYRSSYLIWLCDDLELPYSETVRRYRIQFPDEGTITEDTVRKRHILFLEKLARKYGLKAEEDIEVPGGRVAIRGKQLGHKYNTINGVHVYSAAAGHDVAGTVRRRRAGNEPTEHRGFLKACICVWYDTAKASFEEIKVRLERDYGWNIGANTVKKHYYAERARVYDTFRETGVIDEESHIKSADEDLDQLRLHFQYRQAYLMRKFGENVPAEDVAYMQQLEQIVASKEQDQLQRAQQMGSGPIRMIEEAADEIEEVADEIEEVADEEDVMMLGTDPGPSGDQDVN